MYLSYSEETTEGGWKTHSPPIVIELMNRHLKDFLDFFFNAYSWVQGSKKSGLC